MIDIYYLGHSCFKIKGKKTSLLIDPFTDKLGIKLPKQQADVVLCSHFHENHHNASAVSDSLLVIDGPGEYEIKGTTIIGLHTFHDKAKGKEKGKNTVFKIIIDEVKFAHLGDLGEKLNSEMIEELEDVHVLMVPVGGGDTINFDEIENIIKGIEPRIIIPMHYQTLKYNKNLGSVSEYVKMSGLEPQKISGRLSIAKEKLPEQTMLYIFE